MHCNLNASRRAALKLQCITIPPFLVATAVVAVTKACYNLVVHYRKVCVDVFIEAARTLR